MNIGMMWRYDPAKGLEGEIRKAVDYHRIKYGRADTCLIHPSMLGAEKDKTIEIENLTVRPYRYVLPGNLWIGTEDDSGIGGA